MPLRDSEILIAVKSFKPTKALGLDGLYPLFYQKYWDIVGPHTLDFCKKVFTEFQIPHQANSSLLCLIPKTTDTCCIRNFRPIGLYNIIYKIVTKIMANRINPILPSIIRPS